MNEIMEAERFSKELDKVLAGQAVSDGLDPETAKDLAFAAKLAALNPSGESRLKSSAKARILAKAEESRLMILLRGAGARNAALVAFALLIVAAPFLFKKDSEPEIALNAPALSAPEIAPAPAPQAPAAVPAPESVAEVDGSAAQSYGAALSSMYKRSGMSAVSAVRGYSGKSAGDFIPQMRAPVDREAYAYNPENPFRTVADHPLSTFSIDVDAASYSNVRRILGEGRLPPADAVRAEEFINYFRYGYPEPRGAHPFSITTELAACPWAPKHKLVRIGIKGKTIAKDSLPPSNLVFLIDTSGSMTGQLPLLKEGMKLLVKELRKEDRVSIVAYAGSAGLVLPSTPGSRKEKILEAIDKLEAGGSTAGGAGIQLAYEVARKNFLKKGNNRVILATDGDFNVGVTSIGELTRMIEKKRETGVFLTVLGFGYGNVQDATMESLADKGDGNYSYIDDVLEAKRVLVKEMGGTLFTLAKDVKIQVEFNPTRVQAYKLVGYENRMLEAQDFNDDKKDAGELGAGATVTALYEVVPPGVEIAKGSVDALKYQKPAAVSPDAAASPELLTVKFRYKKPEGGDSLLVTRPLIDENRAWSEASTDFKFAAAAGGFAMVLRGSETKGDLTFDKVQTMAREAMGGDEDGYRAEMVRLIAKAKELAPK